MNLDIEYARQQMVEQQVRAWEVLDLAVLDVMNSVKREQFVPAAFRELAFADTAIPLGYGQHMLPPKVDGRILQALAIGTQDDVLDVGTGSGYLAACLGRLAATVRSVELIDALSQQARKNLLAAAANNVGVETADVFQLGETSRYDAIAVTGSLPVYDERFEQALKVGGRLFVIVGQPPLMEAWKVTRIGDHEWSRTTLFETSIDPLTHAPRPSPFVF